MDFSERKDWKNATWADSLAGIALCLVIIALISLADAMTHIIPMKPHSTDCGALSRSHAVYVPTKSVIAPLSRRTNRFANGSQAFCGRIARESGTLIHCSPRRVVD